MVLAAVPEMAAAERCRSGGHASDYCLAVDKRRFRARKIRRE